MSKLKVQRKSKSKSQNFWDSVFLGINRDDERQKQVRLHSIDGDSGLDGIGIVMVYSTSAILAGDRFQDPYYFLERQALYAGIGLILMMLMMFFPYEALKRFAYPIFILSILVLVAVLIPGIGHRAGGSMRWLKIQSFSFQPSEFAKLGLIIFWPTF